MFRHFIHLYSCGTRGECYLKCQHYLAENHIAKNHIAKNQTHYDKFESCTSSCLAPDDIRERHEHPDMNSTVWPPVYDKAHHKVPLLNGKTCKN
ncbi:BQ5605_C021g09259 [Microbotryum silenes-dioicae]|uniref:BQ5605_C021g09259 protein n=1 Tax=Microbotryum silenes-dioicae TaxID=796604 RepID=A0A2X0MMN9_9BASI|nr:BQ5605_C021g09259 [Microbotryum silenes-dioicae]